MKFSQPSTTLLLAGTRVLFSSRPIEGRAERDRALKAKSKNAKASKKSGDAACGPLSDLGTPNLDRYAGELTLDVTSEPAGCDYHLSLSFKHDPTLPVPSSPSDCAAGEIAPDGLGYLDFRWDWARLPAYAKAATGVDHVSLDFNPCGHPPANVFTVPHYDAHLYLVSPERRTCMTCDPLPGAPVCNPQTQSTAAGRALFNVAIVQPGGQLANMPEGFEFALYDVIPLMGSHSWNVATQPSATAPWVAPVWVMGTYDGALANIEPMFPLSLVTGTASTMHTEELAYMSQTDARLPERYTVAYDGATGVAAVTVAGKSALCGAEFAAAKAAE